MPAAAKSNEAALSNSRRKTEETASFFAGRRPAARRQILPADFSGRGNAFRQLRVGSSATRMETAGASTRTRLSNPGACGISAGRLLQRSARVSAFLALVRHLLEMVMRKTLIRAAATIGIAAVAGLPPVLAEASQPGQTTKPQAAQDAPASSPGEQGGPNQKVQSTGNTHISHDRAAKIARALTATASPQAVTIDVKVGNALPGDAELRALPPAVVALAPEYKGYEYAVAHNQIAIVQPSTRRVVEVISQGE